MSEWLVRGLADIGLSTRQAWAAISEGPCLAVTLNDRQDYFGQTVNIVSRIQHLGCF
ncbi:MAG: hypothetical protein ACJ8CZ_06770 [Microvirga sp.]